LHSYRGKLPSDIFPTDQIPKSEQELFNHSYYQGLLVEIGNLKKYKTFIPNQDRNKRFWERRLAK